MSMHQSNLWSEAAPIDSNILEHAPNRRFEFRVPGGRVPNHTMRPSKKLKTIGKELFDAPNMPRTFWKIELFIEKLNIEIKNLRFSSKHKQKFQFSWICEKTFQFDVSIKTSIFFR